jgi:tRNA threonylcarbamoyladenosine biosynthesis protein TsaB
MRLLAIETSGTIGGIALAEAADLPAPGAPGGLPGHIAGATGGLPASAIAPPLRIIEEVYLGEGMRHARDLVLTMKAACERAAWDPRRLDVLAVSIGPGSFTGIRVAVTVAKFVAWDTGARLVAVPSLRALAENVPADCARAAAILDAKRGGLFASIFERPAVQGATGGLPASAMAGEREGAGCPHPAPGTCDASPGALSTFNEIFGPALIEVADLARRLTPPALILGQGVTKAQEALAAFDLAPKELWDIRPSVVARLGYELHLGGRYTDPLRLEPVYIRPPEAQEVWERNHP